MEVVVAFTNGDQGGDDVIARGVLVVEGSLAEPVSEGVDAEGRLEERRSATERKEQASGHT